MYNNYSTKCGKMSFSTQEEVQRVIQDKKFDVPQWSGRAYECPKCGNWHMATVRNSYQLKDDTLPQKTSRTH